ncbi:MAG: MFS transporter [Proteobacteria bacterium]|jgi:MFS family permease|nr:MAG: MFS transporter [Pseudomonadota bacterium]
MGTVASPRRTVLMLAICQALSMTGTSIVGTTGAIVGNMLTPDKALSTLPIAVQMTGLMTATIPAALLMAKIGRRHGFWIGASIGATGATLATWAIFRADFVLFCCGTYCLGIHNGFVQQYRFAAAEVADDAFRSKAISLVLAGGVFSALFGPETAKWSRDLFAPALFAGCYAMIVGLCLAAATLLYFVDLPKAAAPVLRRSGRPLAEIAAQPVFVAAVIAATVGYGVMSLVMTATPIAMLDCGHEFTSAAFVIQWHSLGMYAPSFVTGHLIARFGLIRILLSGAALLLACCMINLAGLATVNFWAANVALGVGWNFLFIGATTLLTRAYSGEEKAKVQALNDFLVFGTVALSSFASGLLLNTVGWAVVQIAIMPFVAAAGCAVLWLRLQRGRAEPQYAGL